MLREKYFLRILLKLRVHSLPSASHLSRLHFAFVIEGAAAFQGQLNQLAMRLRAGWRLSALR
jgi:hypothetical protein